MSSASTIQDHSDRVVNLDVLRAAAILLVLCFHIENFTRLPAALGFVRGWWCGVELFFVLSGYLIGGLVLKESAQTGRLDVWRFWKRRWLRTAPAYFAALALVFSLKLATSTPAQPFAWNYLLFLQNYDEMPYFGVSWSLCVEEHFYLILPLVIGWCSGRTQTLLVHLLFGICLLLPIVSRWLVHGTDLQQTWYYASHHHCAGLGVGLWLAWLLRRSDDAKGTCARFSRWAFLPAVMVLLLYEWLDLTKWSEWVFGRTLIVAAAGVLVMAAVVSPPWPGSRQAWIRFIALTSYSTYLTHMVVVTAAWRFFHTSTVVVWVVALIGSLCVGGAFWWLIERTSMRWRERLSPAGHRMSGGT